MIGKAPLINARFSRKPLLATEMALRLSSGSQQRQFQVGYQIVRVLEVWLHLRFPLSLRHVEDLLAERGIEVSFQTISEWALRLGLEFACSPRRRSEGSCADKWHLDEMVVPIKGKKY